MSEIKEKLDEILNKVQSTLSEENELKNEIKHIQEELSKLNLLSDQDLEEFSDDIENLTSEVEKLKKEKEDLAIQLANQEKELKNNIDLKIKFETEGLKDRIKTLTNNLEDEIKKTNHSVNKIMALENQLAEMKILNSQYQSKYNNLLDENEITNKNLKRFFGIERQLKDTQDELEKNKEKLSSVNFEEIEQIKLENLQKKKDIDNKNQAIKENENEINNQKAQISKLKDENFTKFDRINALENDIKIKNNKINELTQSNEAINKSIAGLIKDKEELNIKLKTFNTSYENKIANLKVEIEKIYCSNEILLKEKDSLKSQLDNIGYVSSFAKANKEMLTKRDFSILETMSRRVEESELLILTLKEQINELTKYNKTLENQVQIGFLIDKEEIETKIKNHNFDEEDFSDIMNINDKGDLMNHILLLKKENIILQQQLSDITIECNKILRESNK